MNTGAKFAILIFCSCGYSLERPVAAKGPVSICIAPIAEEVPTGVSHRMRDTLLAGLRAEGYAAATSKCHPQANVLKIQILSTQSQRDPNARILTDSIRTRVHYTSPKGQNLYSPKLLPLRIQYLDTPIGTSLTSDRALFSESQRRSAMPQSIEDWVYEVLDSLSSHNLLQYNRTSS